MTTEIHVGDIGTIIRFTVTESGTPLDISSATQLKIKLLRKDKSVLEKTGTGVSGDVLFTTDGTDGQCQFTTVSGDINIKGKWKGQVYLVMPGGSWHTSKVDIEVDDNVDT